MVIGSLRAFFSISIGIVIFFRGFGSAGFVSAMVLSFVGGVLAPGWLDAGVASSEIIGDASAQDPAPGE
jgi:hypothetical protein